MSELKEIVVEVARFGVKAGVSPAQVLEAARASQRYLAGCEGFLSRRLCEPEGPGEPWVDLVEWRDQAAAEKAAAGIMESADCRAFMEIIDETKVSMAHPRAHAF